MDHKSKEIAWIKGEIKTPPFTRDARIKSGLLLRRLQLGEKLSQPESKPIKSIGKNCHELKIKDKDLDWRIIYHIHTEAIVILEVFAKKNKENTKGGNC